MKATIKGRVYDTNKATLIAKDDNGFCPMDERYMEERLYQKADGEYFVYGHGGSMSPYGEREGTKMVGTVVCRLHRLKKQSGGQDIICLWMRTSSILVR